MCKITFINKTQSLTWQFLFHILANVVSIYAVAVAYREEVEAELVQHVGHQDVAVLVLLVWVAGLVTYRCCVGELRDAVETFTGSLYSLLRGLRMHGSVGRLWKVLGDGVPLGVRLLAKARRCHHHRSCGQGVARLLDIIDVLVVLEDIRIKFIPPLHLIIRIQNDMLVPLRII